MRGITRQTFDTNDCDLLLDMPATGFEGIITTNPVYKTTYVLAYRSDRGIEIDSLDDPDLKTLKIGVFQTSGLRTALTRRGIISNVSLHVLSHNADLKPENQPYQQVQKVIDGQLDVAGVWGPFAGWLKTMKGAPLTIVPTNMWEEDIPQEFELAIGLRRVDWVLKYKLDLALEARRVEIETILRDYGVPLGEVQQMRRILAICRRMALTTKCAFCRTRRRIPRRRPKIKSSIRRGSTHGWLRGRTSIRSLPTRFWPATWRG
jgi:hypothetical protein